jgi:1-deoxy-D-xylulose-5-phosphate synthase
MELLSALTGPAELRRLDATELQSLAAEIRTVLVDEVCRGGGHLGSNLGVVELTIALHRVFDSPRTPIVFDTGHQAYVHKLLTGRADDFGTLRQADGLSGYPSRAESEHDVVENSHASTALSYAYGLRRAAELAGEDRTVVAVVGDGALTGGLAWEALNNLGASRGRVVVVLNDNGRSYAPTVGGLSHHLERIADRSGYAALVARLGSDATVTAVDDRPNLFRELGFRYLGPVDGHDLAALEAAFARAAAADAPVVVHCRTRKGAGYGPAEADDVDRLHSVGSVDVATGRPSRPQAPSWTDVFSQCLLELGRRHPEIVAVSAAMVEPTGLAPFAAAFPDRCLDVGIAEQHAVTSAAGLAMGGAHPVVALYATFAGRAFDQVLLDVGLHRAAVTFVLDRAGITGPDGPSHHGLWDLPLLAGVPGMRVAAPRDGDQLAEQLQEAVGHHGGPTALRYPKGAVPPSLPAVERWRGMDLLRAPRQARVLLVPVGPMAPVALEAADRLAAGGVECTVIDPRWVLPVNTALAGAAAAHELVVTLEDGVRAGGVGSRLAQLLADRGCVVPVRTIGLPTEYLPHGTRSALLSRHGLDADGVVAAVESAGVVDLRAGLGTEGAASGGGAARGLALTRTRRRS